MSKKNQPEKRGSFVRTLGMLLVLAVLFAVIYLAAAPLTEVDKNETAEGSESWMAALPDDRPLNEIAVPGTHDSATQYCQLAYFSKCQYKNIAAQLTAGFRYLDIRLAVENDSLVLRHGFTYCMTGPLLWSGRLYLDTVLEECFAFLKDNPTETVLFCVKQEYGDESIAEFQKLLAQYISRNEAGWLLTDRIPTLGEARGKIVLLRRYEDEAGMGKKAGISFIWDHQGGRSDISLHTAARDNGTFTLWVQDRYEYDADEKWTAFLNGIRGSTTAGGAVSLHFLSTKGSFVQGHPYAFAKDLNKRLMAESLPADCGWVIVDFATAPVAEHIYTLNKP